MFLFFLILFSADCLAVTTTCVFANNPIGTQSISWDDSGKAYAEDSITGFHEGVVTSVRPFNDDGNKINISVKLNGFDYQDGDEAEYLIFPVNREEFRVISVSYVYVHGDRYLNMSEGNYPAKCWLGRGPSKLAAR